MRIRRKILIAVALLAIVFSAFSVYALATKGIVNGYADGSFLPTANATRAQTAKIIYTAFFAK